MHIETVRGAGMALVIAPEKGAGILVVQGSRSGLDVDVAKAFGDRGGLIFGRRWSVAQQSDPSYPVDPFWRQLNHWLVVADGVSPWSPGLSIMDRNQLTDVALDLFRRSPLRSQRGPARSAL